MALKLYDKLTPSGDFALIDAEDVLMPDGKRLSEFESNSGTGSSGGSGSGLPDVTTADNGKIMQVVDGAWKVLALADSAVATYIDDYINEALGGEY